MSSTHHVMPRDLFMALARGGGGLDAVQALKAAQHSKHVILLRAVLAGAQPDDRLAHAGHELLAKVQKFDRAAAEAVISYPSVGAWALHTLRRDQSVAGATPDGLAAIAAAAAIRAQMDTQVEVPVIDGTVVLPSLGIADAEGSTATVATAPGEVRSRSLRVAIAAGAAGWRDIRHIQAEVLDLFIDDLDPFRMPTTDGEPTGRLTPPQVTEMTAMLSAAWRLLDPHGAAEIAALVQVIVPFGAPDGGYVSTSSPQAFG